MKRRAGQKRKVIKEPTKAENIAKTRRMPARMKGGGEVMNYKSGGTVSKSKATGAAKRGLGKAYMKGKR